MNARWKQRERCGMAKIGRAGTAAAILLAVAIIPLAVMASDAELFFSTDKNGEDRVTKIREGDQIWIVVHDPDEDIDCDVRDKIWTDIKVMDVKTGAHIVWKSYIDAGGADTNNDGLGDVLWGQVGYIPHKGHWPGPTAGWLQEDFLEETNRNTGLFVSIRPFMIGTRVNYSTKGIDHAHIPGPFTPAAPFVNPTDFHWGGYLYAVPTWPAPLAPPPAPPPFGDSRVWVAPNSGTVAAAAVVAPGGNAYTPPGVVGAPAGSYMFGRFENNDTIAGLYVDQNDMSDVGLTLAKLNDVEAAIEWGREVYKDANASALITITDPDENLSCSEVESVPVFIIVNPGSWNPVRANSPTTFCALKQNGGVSTIGGAVLGQPILWYNIYRNYSYAAAADVFINLAGDGSNQPNAAGTYYIEYPTPIDGNVTAFDTASNTGITRVMFYAQETRADSGVFQLKLNSILRDLGFNSLDVRDVLTAYYIDPNDQDDFKLATAYIEEKRHSTLRFTDNAREDKSEFWIGRDPVYIEVVDRNANVDNCCPENVLVHVCDPHEVDDVEWLVLDELSSNSPTFFSNLGMRLISVWDALGVGEAGTQGGYSLILDNWELEAFNEDSVYARYNDVNYVAGTLGLIGDMNIGTAFPPVIANTRVDNDLSFGIFEIGDTQVFDGEGLTMRFLDRQGNEVSGYLNSDCVFLAVVDPDQNEDPIRRERIDGTWDGTAGAGQHYPFGPLNAAANHLPGGGYADNVRHPINDLLGDTEIFNQGGWAKIYILNPRNGLWAAVDLLETGVATAEFVSVTCVDLASQYMTAPSLNVLPGDTILAAYNDPSNHSDAVWISIKVGQGGGGAVGSSLSFVDAEDLPVAAYLFGDPIYVKVVDSSLAGAGTIPDAVTIDGETYSLAAHPSGEPGVFLLGPLDLAYGVGETVTATYVDPSDSRDTSTATVQIVASELEVERFYAGPNPFDDVVTFSFVGQGLAETFSVSIYDLRGRRLWTGEDANVLGVTWDGRNERGDLVASGAYIYVVAASGSGNTFEGKGTLFVRR